MKLGKWAEMCLKLKPHQVDALERMKNGCILCGGVGSGKSRTALAYYYICNGGSLAEDDMYPMPNPVDLYIITTARKRDTKEWEAEMREPPMRSEPLVKKPG